MKYLKHVTLKHGNVNFVRVCALNLLSVNIFHNVVVRVESKCVIKANHVFPLCWLVRFCAGKTTFALKRSYSFPAQIERINRATRYDYSECAVGWYKYRLGVPHQHWILNKLQFIKRATFSNTFSLFFLFVAWLKFYWSLFPTIGQHW